MEQSDPKKILTSSLHSNVHERKKIFILIGLFITLIASVLIALTIGVYQISIIDVFSTILYHIIPVDDLSNFNSLYDTIVWNIRFPRIILSVGVGISLAAAGGIYQGCFRNPLVEPYILGVESGAAFGAAMAIVIPTFFLSLQVSAFLFGGIAVFSAYLLARVRGETPVIMLILSGVIIGSIFTAFVSILKYVATDAALREIVFWLMGGFYYASWSDVFLVIPIILISFFLVWLLSWKLNILSMGDEEAKTLGVNPEWYKAFFIILATLMTALSVSVVGVIAWVGLMMPHAARMIIGPDHRFMLPTAAMMGGIYLILCDTIARTLTSAEIPVGILTSIIGAPYLLYLIRNKGKLTFGVD